MIDKLMLIGKLFTILRSPPHERVEKLVKAAAEHRSDVEYHRYMGDYYYGERCKITPHTGADEASEYARLFHLQEEHQDERTLAERKFGATKAKIAALTRVD